MVLPAPLHDANGHGHGGGGKVDDDGLRLAQRGRTSYDLNGKIMLASIISLSVVVVLVALLHIYARWLLQRQARRRAAALHSLGLAARANHPSEPPPKTGLDPSVIASLPTFVFRMQPNLTVQDGATLATVSECAVCLSVLEDEEVVRLLPNCKHTFHVECIDKWFTSHSTCPMCRAEAQPEARPELVGGQSVAGGRLQTATAPPLERTGSVVSSCVEGTSSDGPGASSPHSHKRSGSMSKLSPFRRMLSRERSSRRVLPGEDIIGDIERQP